MSVLRMTMEITRIDRNGVGVHAGSKICNVKTLDGSIKCKGGLFFGLSGTGKTSLTCYTHPSFDSSIGEFTVVLQDDVNYFMSDGTLLGSEHGFYVKCDSCPEHIEITKAVTAAGAILENVAVNNNRVDWKDFSHTNNTRAVVNRSDILCTADFINTNKLKFIVFITRRPELPPICKLADANQAAAYYALGESIITSAENEQLAGKSKRQLGFDPFIIGNHVLNVERVRNTIEKLMNNDKSFEVYLVNTGYVGVPENDITVSTTIKYIEDAIRENTMWGYNIDLKCSVPIMLEHHLNPEKFYGSNYSQIINDLREERVQYLKEYGISEEIIKSI